MQNIGQGNRYIYQLAGGNMIKDLILKEIISNGEPVRFTEIINRNFAEGKTRRDNRSAVWDLLESGDIELNGDYRLVAAGLREALS
jgi:hypothetical protein